MRYLYKLLYLFIILGFLLGKYATDRDYKLKEIHNSDLISNFNEIQNIRKSLIETSSHINISDKNQLNSIIFNEFIKCTDNKDIDNFSDTFDDFITKFVPNHLHVLVKCYKDLNEFIKKI